MISDDLFYVQNVMQPKSYPVAELLHEKIEIFLIFLSPENYMCVGPHLPE